MRGKKDTVCANVVTFNRKALLIECLDALMAQARKLDGIYIIDNASTDDTPVLLMEKGYIDKLPPGNLSEDWKITKDLKGVKVNYVRMVNNTGSSGGQHEGIKRAYDDGYDWVWVMDDDGLVLDNTLQNLCKHCCDGDVHVLNSLVLDKNNPSEICFGYNYGYNISDNRLGKTYYFFKELDEAVDIDLMDGLGQAFNSTMINRQVISKVGLPLKELFIRGDEVEYLYRIQTSGYRTYTVKSSLIYHPNPQMIEKNIMGKNIKFEYLSGFKLYHTIKNYIYIYVKYFSIITGLEKIIKMLLINFFMIFYCEKGIKNKLNGVVNLIKGFISGVFLLFNLV